MCRNALPPLLCFSAKRETKISGNHNCYLKAARTRICLGFDFYVELALKEKPYLLELYLKQKILRSVKYRGSILLVTSPALGSNDLSLDQSGTSIQILPEPKAVK